MPLSELQLGLACYGLLLVGLVGYVYWNIRVRGLHMRRKAEQDERVIKKADHDPEENSVDYRLVGLDMSARMVPANSGLIGITIAAVFIVAALLVTQGDKVTDKWDRAVLYVVLGCAATAAICWLFSLDQIIQMASPSTGRDRMVRFYKYSQNLWLMGMVLIMIALLLFLLVVNVYLAIAVALLSGAIVLQYWKINNDW